MEGAISQSCSISSAGSGDMRVRHCLCGALAMMRTAWTSRNFGRRYCKCASEVFDEDVGDDKRLGVAKLPLIDLEAETEKEFELRLLASLDTLKVKDKRDRGALTVKVLYHQFNKEEQLAALEAEKKLLEERKKLKEAGSSEAPWN